MDPLNWIIVLSVAGIVLICLEMFLPGIIAGVVGVICLVIAVGLTYYHYGAAKGNMAAIGLMIATATGLALWITLVPKTIVGKFLITRSDMADSKSADSLESLMGKNGRAVTPLRPAGTAIIENRRVDVVAESGLIDSQSPVNVVRVEGNRVVVRKI